MKIFKINNYIALKFENNRTNIYIKGELFRQCKFLLLDVPVNDKSLSNVESIDEVVEKLGEKKGQVPPKTEFWGHCSNLQAWHENNYNSCLLHRNLAFPLLKKLTMAGDLLAKKIFKEEIAKRFASRCMPVINYLIEEGYLKYLNNEEFECVLDDLKESHINYIICPERKLEFINDGILDLKNRGIDDLTKIIGFENTNSITELDLINNQLKKLPDSIGKLESLQRLYLYENKLTTLPESIGKLKSLRELCLRDNELIMLPESIGDLRSLERLDLSMNKLVRLPETIGKLQSLRELILDDNQIRSLPESIGELKSLETLFLRNNNLTSLSDSISSLQSLKQLDLSINKITILPESLGDLLSLEGLFLEDNLLTTLPNSICNLESLQKLLLNWNKLTALPESIGNLKSLKILHLYDNKLVNLPGTFTNLHSSLNLHLNGNELLQKLENSGIEVYI